MSVDMLLFDTGGGARITAQCRHESPDYLVEAVSLRTGNASARLQISGAGPRIPAELVMAGTDGFRLKRVDELTEDLRAAYAALRGSLADLTFDENSGFFELPASVRVKARIRITLPDFPTAAVPPSVPAIAFEAAGEIRIAATNGASGSLTISVTLGGAASTANLAPSFRWPTAGFALPEPLLFDALNLADFKGSWPAGVTVPGWIAGTTLAWATPPKLTVKAENGVVRLRFDDGTEPGGPLAGTLKVNGAELVQITQFKVAGALNDLKVTLALAGPADRDVPDGHLDLGPLRVDWKNVKVAPTLAASVLKIATKVERLTIASSEPAATIAVLTELTTSYDLATGKTETQLTKFELKDPNMGQLANVVGKELAGLLRIVVPLRLGAGMNALLDRLSAMAKAVIAWLADGAGSTARTLVGLGHGAANLAGSLFEALRKVVGTTPTDLVIELRWDPSSCKLRQLIVSRVGGGLAPESIGIGELTVTLPPTSGPMLVLDLETKWAAIAIAPKDGGTIVAKFETDLWLADKSGTSPVRSTPGRKPLIEVSATAKGPTSGAEAIALVLLQDGRPSFFQTLGAGPVDKVIQGPPVVLSIGAPLAPGPMTVNVDLQAKLNTDGFTSLFPTGSGTESRAPIVKITDYKIESGSNATKNILLKLDVDPRFGSSGPIKAEVRGELDLRRFSLRLKEVEIPIKAPDPIDVFGIRLDVKPGDGEKAFVLLLGKAPSIRLHEKATAKLTFEQIGSDRESLAFVASGSEGFCLAAAGLDLNAKVVPDPVRLAGLDTPFRFTSGQIRMERGKLLSASISGNGELPRALLGEARIEAAIQLARENDKLVVQSATARLEKAGEPLVCESTRFRFELTHVGLRFLTIDGRAQFFAELTGSAMFRPNPGEFGGGLLGRLPEIRINLDRAPLTGDGRALAKSINFQVPIEPPARTKLFDLFEFELRGIGFHPSFDGWSDRPPALALSGQARFTESFDVVQPSFEFHKMWITRPAGNGSLPRVRMDGLGVGLRIGAMGEFEATAVAVDDSLNSIYRPGVMPANVTAKGFLASGRLMLKGWAAMSGAAGFLELAPREEVKEGQDKRLTFFIYAQQERLAEPIPTPVGTLYLREIGFGFGFRYTLAGLAQTDDVKDPRRLIAILDPLSKQQGDLASFPAWQPELRGDRLTLAMRALFSVTTASSPAVYNEKKERDLANPVLFDVVAALRSDLTFLLSARAWIAVNYADWLAGAKDWREKPLLRGYIYISAPRQTFLGRLVSDRAGHVGTHPELPPQLIKAFRQVSFTSTLYITPGLFHQEFGWPYELEVDLAGENPNFGAKLNGGVILRIEDGAVLQGIAFRGSGFVRVGGRAGGRIGASAQAHARFSIGGKFIAYVSVVRPAATLFYGRLSLALTLELSIQFWVEFRFFTLRAGWRERIDVDIDLELAVGPRGIGAHARASVSLRRFGRGLRLGVSAGFNGGMLGDARGRVERFMQLGLGATVPDPETGLSPLPEPARAARAERGDKALTELATNREAMPVPENPDQPAPVRPVKEGSPITGSDFWAIYFPVKGNDSLAVLQLVPRDTEVLGGSTLLGGPDEGDFFVAPVGIPDATGHRTTGHHYVFDGDADALKRLKLVPRQKVEPKWSAIVDPASGATLGDLVAGGFMGLSAGKLTQPPAKVSNQESLADALGCLEARGALIGHVCDLAKRLADELSRKPDARSLPDDIDPQWFGLTFILRAGGNEPDGSLDEVLDKLFGHPDPRTLRRSALFTVKKSDVVDPNAPVEAIRKCELFNPPERMFDIAQPRLAEPRIGACDRAIRLDWDLEPLWGASADRYDDPEYRLLHYAIQRHIEVDGERRFRSSWLSKRAATFGPDGKEQKPDYQALDSLADLPEALRDALLKQASSPDTPWAGGRGEQEAAVKAWDEAFPRARKVDLVYSAIAVDVSGAQGDPSPPIVISVEAPPPVRLPQFSQIGLTFVFSRFPGSSDRIAEMRIDIPKYEDLGITQPDGQTRRTGIDLFVQTDDEQRSGIYGADLLDAERHIARAPSAARSATAKLKKGDPSGTDVRVIVYYAEPRDQEPEVFRCPQSLIEELVSSGPGVRSSQIFARATSLTNNESTWAPWTKCDLQLRIEHERDDQDDLRAPVAEFEMPRLYEPSLLLHHRTMTAEQGRLWNTIPTIEAVLDPDGTPPKLRFIPDQENRSGIRLRWHARPVRLADGTPARPDLIGGFDLFMASRDRESTTRDNPTNPDELRPAELARLARPLGRVMVKPRFLLASEPAQIEDFSKLQVAYPSDAARTGKVGWFSSAETRVIWPALLLRRSLMLVPDEGLIGQLYANGWPKALKLRFAVGVKNDKPIYWPLRLDRLGSNPHDPRADDGWWTLPPTLKEPHEFRLLLQDLMWVDEPQDRKGDETGGILEIRYASGLAQPVTMAVDIALTGDLHPILADVVDFLRYSPDSYENGAGYRPYEPVMEGTPPPIAGAPGIEADQPLPTERPQFAQLLSDTAPERDRAGWAALRQLGLAVGLRLWDTETGDWLYPGDVWRRRFAWAWKRALDRYGDLTRGSPFLEQLFDPEELFGLGSDDELAAPRRPGQQGMPLVQIGLRPIADRIDSPSTAKCVYYFNLVSVDGPVITASRMKAEFGTDAVFVELLSAPGDRATRTSIWVGMNVDAKGKPVKGAGFEPVPIHRFPAREAAALESAVPMLARLVICSAQPPTAAEAAEKLAASVDRASSPPPAHLKVTVNPWNPLEPGNTRAPNPYFAFQPLPAELLRGVEAAREDGHQRLRKLAARRFAVPPQETEEECLAIQRWESRFIDHGPGRPPSPDKPVGYAVATIDAPAGLRRAPNDRGEISILYIDKSRLGSWRRFYIRPFGRYDHLAVASGRLEDRRAFLAEDDFAPGLSTKTGAAKKTAERAALATIPWVDATLARTLAVARPVVLAADRHRDGSRNALIVVAALSDEEILAAANIPQAGARQIAHSAIGWTHGLNEKVKDWARLLIPGASDPVLDVEPPSPPAAATLRDWLIDRATPPAAGTIGRLDGLPDLWRGAHAWAAYDLPYFYDYHALLFTAAGTAVSPAMRIALPSPEPKIDNDWPAEPTWKFANGEILITLPLIRFVDCMDGASKRAWYPQSPGPATPLFELPDPGIVYRIFLRSIEGEVRTAEFDLEANPANGTMILSLTGRAFGSGSASTPSRNGHWSIQVRLKPNGFNPAAPPIFEVVPIRHATAMPVRIIEKRS